MRIYNTFLYFFLFLSLSPVHTLYSLDETSLYQGVLQIRSYKYDPSSGLYELDGYGSSVSIGGGRLITNAHVVLDTTSREPYGTYEVCQSISFEREPRCFSLAKLESYDIDNDLALVTLDKGTSLAPISFSKEKKYPIGSPLIVYGYPAIGGSTITRTAGRIAGYNEPFYKIDGIIDSGNSGGGAFSLSGQLLGIPSRIIVENASLGYMIPTSTVELFLRKKTPGYTKYTLPPPSDFREFLDRKYSEVARNYTFRNSSISIPNMRPYGVKFLKNNITNASDSHISLTFLHEKKKMQFHLICGKVSPLTQEFPYWKQAMSRDSEMVSSNRSRFATIREYIQKNQYVYVIYDTQSPCFILPSGYIDPKKDIRFLSDLERFFDEGIKKKNIQFDTSSGFLGSFFSIQRIPDKMLIVEYPDFTGKTSMGVYFENDLGKGSSAISRILSFDREKDMISSLVGYADAPDNPKISDIDTLLSRNLSSKEKLLSGSTLTGNRYYIMYGGEEKKEEKGKPYSYLSVIILLHQSGEKYGYLTLWWNENSPWLDDKDVEKIQKFITSLSLRDQK